MNFAVQEVSKSDLAFGGKMDQLLPPYETVPVQFRMYQGNKWEAVISDWFYKGLKNVNWKPKAGIDTERAVRHISAILVSWDSSHEHKIAGSAFLLSEWFDDVTYETIK